MSKMKKGFYLTVFWAVLSFLTFPMQVWSQQGQNPKHGPVGSTAPGSGKALAFSTMAGPGQKVVLPNGYYFTYGFNQKPKLGTVIVKVEIYTKEGKKDTSYELKGDSGMPSMKGHHDLGEQPFQLSKKGDYLLPINIVMPGDWEIRLTFLKEGRVQFRGSYPFDV